MANWEGAMNDDEFDKIRAELRQVAKEHVESYPHTVEQAVQMSDEDFARSRMTFDKVKKFLGNFDIRPGMEFITPKTFEKVINIAASWHGAVFAQRLADAFITSGEDDDYFFSPETWEEVCEVLVDEDTDIILEEDNE